MKLKKLILLALLSCACSSTALLAESDPLVEQLDKINEQLALEGRNVAIYSMELLGSGETFNMGRTVLASDRGNKQLGIDWALNDPNRLDANGNPRTNITYAIDTAEFTGDFSATAQPDIVRFGLETWDEQKCSNIGIEEVLAPVQNIGWVAGFFRGENDHPVIGADFGADIVHGGFKSDFGHPSYSS